MPLVLQQRGLNKKPLKPVQKIPQTLPLPDGSHVAKIHAFSQRDHDAVYDLDPLIDAMNAVEAFEHLSFMKDVEHHILTFVKQTDGN
jgi:hypothetical protein